MSSASARTEAERARGDAHAEARRVRQAAEQLKAQQTTELQQHRDSELSDMAEQKTALEAVLRHLGQVERSYQERMRSFLERMRSFLTEQMDQLNALGRSEQAPREADRSHNAA